MSIFAPRSSMYEPNYSGLFRLIDHFDKYHNESGEGNDSDIQSKVLGFTPKFDVQETPSTYILHGDLPGVDKDKISITFADEQTISISGKVERESTRESSEDANATGTDAAATGEEKPAEAEAKDKEVAVTSKQQELQQQQKPKYKYWISERNYGEFSRSFTFPSPVDHSAIVATLDNGVLNVVVPKATKPQPRRIEIQ